MKTVVITLAQLVAADACYEDRQRFLETFGEQVEVTPELLQVEGRRWDMYFAVSNNLFPGIGRFDLEVLEADRPRDEEKLVEAVKSYEPHECCPSCTYTKMSVINLILNKVFDVATPL